MISAFPAYSWLATLPASITVVVDGDSEALTTTDVDPRGLSASGAVADVLAATLATHTGIASAVVAYDFASVPVKATVTCTLVGVGPVVVTGLERFGVVSGSYGSALSGTAAIVMRAWDGLWCVSSYKDVREVARFVTARSESRYGKARTQTRLARVDSAIDEHLVVPGRWVDPRYAAMAAYAEVAGVDDSLTYGTLRDLVEAQLAGARDTGPNLSPTPWLWRHTSDSDLAGTAIDLVLPDGEFELSDIASPASGGGRRVNVSLAWLTL